MSEIKLNDNWRNALAVVGIGAVGVLVYKAIERALAPPEMRVGKRAMRRRIQELEKYPPQTCVVVAALLQSTLLSLTAVLLNSHLGLSFDPSLSLPCVVLLWFVVADG